MMKPSYLFKLGTSVATTAHRFVLVSWNSGVQPTSYNTGVSTLDADRIAEKPTVLHGHKFLHTPIEGTE